MPLPNSTVGTAPLQEYYDHWRKVSKSKLGVTGVLGSIAFQPMPKTYAQKAKDRGGVSRSFPTEKEVINRLTRIS